MIFGYRREIFPCGIFALFGKQIFLGIGIFGKEIAEYGNEAD